MRKQKEMLGEGLLPSEISLPRELLTTDFLRRMGTELVRLCDSLEKHGLVDYQFGVWEDEIIECKFTTLPHASICTSGLRSVFSAASLGRESSCTASSTLARRCTATLNIHQCKPGLTLRSSLCSNTRMLGHHGDSGRFTTPHLQRPRCLASQKRSPHSSQRPLRTTEHSSACAELASVVS